MLLATFQSNSNVKKRCMPTYSGFSICFLIAASLVEGWVPSVSRVFHFWQSAPRLNNAFSASTTEPPSHEPPQKGKTGIRHTEKCGVDKKRGRGEERNWLKETLWHKNAAQRNLTPHATESRERRCGCDAGTDRSHAVGIMHVYDMQLRRANYTTKS